MRGLPVSLALTLASLASFGAAPLLAAPGESCAVATPELQVLPYLTSGTTEGRVDDYHWNFDDPPQCASSASTCIADNVVYPGTGRGPDYVYAVRTNVDCTLEISLDPTDLLPNDDDLALFVFQSTCSNDLTDCICVSDFGLFGDSETVSLQAKGGVIYYVVADGFSPDADVSFGPYELSITVSPSGACQLCPAGGCGVGSTVFSDGFDSGGCNWSSRVPEYCFPP